jgi:cell division protein FtsW (lipid II flippase)
MVSRKAFTVLIIIELFIAIIFFNIAKTWPMYSIDVLFLLFVLLLLIYLELIGHSVKKIMID